MKLNKIKDFSILTSLFPTPRTFFLGFILVERITVYKCTVDTITLFLHYNLRSCNNIQTVVDVYNIKKKKRQPC